MTIHIDSANTNAIEAADREEVVRIAKTWLGTPYHHMARLKGVGCDCLTVIAEVYTEAGLIARPIIPFYPHDFMNHKGAETYMAGILQYAREVEAPETGDIGLWQFGRCFSHGGIVTRWPCIIHAYLNIGCVEEDVQKAKWLSYMGDKPRPVRFFSYWGG